MDKLILHGVLMEVAGTGVLLTGEGGVGKSEVALELISRGHRLVADDAPEFRSIHSSHTPPLPPGEGRGEGARVPGHPGEGRGEGDWEKQRGWHTRAPSPRPPLPEGEGRRNVDDSITLIHGECPALLQDYLEVRGLGILNIRAMFGDGAIAPGVTLQLIVHLVRMDGAQLNQLDRLRPNRDNKELFGHNVPRITLPVAPGRDLAVLVEAAVRNHQLALRGYDATEDFTERLRGHIEKGTT